ncbi:methylmalonate-semialdehyde dehydrogenase [Paenibacillus macerans]|uniref:Malonate-semialdehyde dehydrogenase n=1 Tax=Paenibacillus macerans TaxID=44252 RepID=A0A090YLT4_PAEMA|nr:methylmalonate-semialdehyde dehydrogenase [Paenibacillus macerans]KFM93075.1 methylmalonate-semialdehyde dehydrogenase [Paenibacillus macerans]MBS5911597.1 methylmalonate-semialdehyde dehydrogenase [Paenibacillus macerans]MCY7561406.1 methylmalonate-semialdehyde dehydrogenase [Paenibacillus macerans]MDU5946185.1 methylmalonate-semialdehyde dehydrogenase [Paenibacillus macerans]MEC0136061.1 methylmalonate-semialdehyde dehydrogenase [Paenibacillus macerans]
MSEVEILKNYINGEWVKSATDRYEDVYNPATNQVIARVPLSTKEEIDHAVEVAAEAFKSWQKVAVPRRARILFNYQQLLTRHKEELAKLITIENGKNLTEALGEVGRGIENVEFAAGAPTLMMGDSLASIATDVEAVNYRYPLGVVGGIAPFNFPMMVPCWMFPMAIALGNTFILKPSERTPLLTRRLAELFEEAGLPKGVFNVVYGAHDVVNGILDHPEVKAVSFVGSKPVGEYVFKRGSQNLKRVQALTGAKNHTIVLNDANLEDTVTNVISAAFGSAGERCMACAVVTVEEGIADEFIALLKEKAQSVKIGNGLDDGVFLGPVIREENKRRTLQYIEKGLEEGASLICDGRENTPDQGYFVGPTIFENVTTEMTIWKEEIFAPVLSVIRVKNLKEAVEIANRSEFANGACIFTSNASAIRYFRENIDAGMLGVNLGVPAPMAFFPFSGWKSSFFGTLHANGKDSVDFYTHKKVVTARYAAPAFE